MLHYSITGRLCQSEIGEKRQKKGPAGENFVCKSYFVLRADAQEGRLFSRVLRADACGDESTKSIVFLACAAGGQEDRYFLVSCALTLADLGSCRSLVFLSFRTGPERTLGPGPLWTFPAPKEREERLPLLWIPPPPPQVQPHVSFGSVVQFRLNFVISGLQGPHQVSQLESIVIRSTPRMQRNVLVLHPMKVLSENVRSRSDTYAQHLHLDEVKRADTCKWHLWR